MSGHVPAASCASGHARESRFRSVDTPAGSWTRTLRIDASDASCSITVCSGGWERSPDWPVAPTRALMTGEKSTASQAVGVKDASAVACSSA